MNADDRFQEALGRALDLLVLGGFAKGWLTDQERILVDWAPGFLGGTGGEAAFLGFLDLLLRLSPDADLAPADQSMLLMLRDELYEQREGGEGRGG